MTRKRKGDSSYSPSKRYKKAAYRRKRYTSRVASRKTISRIARQVVLRAAESKSKPSSHGKLELYHNVPGGPQILNYESNVHMPIEGSGDNERNGDRIMVRGFRIRCLYGSKWDRPNITWRVICAAVPKTYSYNYNTFFRPISGNALLDDINTDLVTVLFQKYMKPQQSTMTKDPVAGESTSLEYTFCRRYWLPRKVTYKFQDDGSYTHNDKQIFLLTLAYDAFGTLATDNIGYVQTWCDLVYKDP